MSKIDADFVQEYLWPENVDPIVNEIAHNHARLRPLVSIVIPTFNRKNDLLHCLRSVINSTYRELEIIVVDNASTDGTSEAVQKLYPFIKLIKLERNTGVTGGRNTGARLARGEFILFLDHDMIVDKNMVGELVDTMLRDRSIGVAGPIIYFYDEPRRIWAAGTSINMRSGRIYFNEAGTTHNRFSEHTSDVQIIPAAIMVTREILQRIGLFDDIFFAVYEDTDFCFRVKEAGYRVVCVPNAEAWHKVPVATEKQELHVLSRSYYVARNRIIFMKKHAKPRDFMIFLILFVPVYAAYYTWRSLRHGRQDFIKEYWRGLLDGLRKTL